MKDDFNNNSDNEFDNVFKEAIEQMDLRPSEETRNKIKASILERENALFRRKFILWRSIATSLLALLLLGASYVFNLQNKISPVKNELTKNALNTATPSEQERETEKKDFTTATIETFKTSSHNNSDEPQQLVSKTENKPEDEKNELAQTQVTTNKQLNKKQNSLSNTNVNPMVAVTKDAKMEAPINMIGERYKDIPLDFFVNLSGKDTTLIISIITASAGDTTNNLAGNKINSVDKTTTGSKFFVSAFYTPSMAKYMLKDNNTNDNLTVADVNARQQNEYSYSAGVKLGYDLNSKWSAQIGCLYSVSTIDIKPFSIYCQQAANGSLYYSCVTSMGVVQFPAEKGQWAGDAMTITGNSSQTLGFISVPLQLLYNIPFRKFIFYASPGVTTNIAVQSQTNITYNYQGDIENKQFNTIEGLKTFNYQFTLGVGAKYNIYKHFYITVEPTFRGPLMAINDNSVPIKNYPCFFGLGLGLVYHF